MPSPVPLEYRCESREHQRFSAYYAALILFSLHWALVLYVNSSYLKQLFTGQTISILYVLSAVCTIGLFLYAPSFLRRFGNIKLIYACTLLEMFALIGMAFVHSPILSLLLFILHQTVVPLILFNLDVLMEELIGKKEGTTGSYRGLLLTVMSLTGVIASFCMGRIIGDSGTDFAIVYLVSAFFLIPFLIIIFSRFRDFCDPVYPDQHIRLGLKEFWYRLDVRNVFFAHFLLQIFFTWMVIYTPLYLAEVIGFNWTEIGLIFSVGLMAYVLLEYGIGYIADTYIGEKEMMAVGFAILAFSTSWFIFLDHASMGLWMFAMFMTRVGASLVETTTESYFFKHTTGKDTDVISIFRITRPLSYVVGATLGALALMFFKFELLFLILGILMLPGLFFTMALRDTK